MTALRHLYELFPPRARERIKLALHAHGHGQSGLDGLKARDHARGKKRLDRVAEAFAAVLARAGLTSLKGLTCLEFGAGYVPTEVLVFHLLGASRAVATDYNAIARLDQLVIAARQADRRRVLELLSPLADGVDLEQRLDAVRGGGGRRYIAENILYRAPHDMIRAPLSPAFDVIHSVSVFEHLPVGQLGAILTNLISSLALSGRMITEIDLRDHRDMRNRPLAFWSPADDYDPATDADRRGNRLRRSDWLKAFAGNETVTTEIAYVERLDRRFLPPGLAIGENDEGEMLVSWLELVSKYSGHISP